jgi:hypothetical protein
MGPTLRIGIIVSLFLLVASVAAICIIEGLAQMGPGGGKERRDVMPSEVPTSASSSAKVES